MRLDKDRGDIVRYVGDDSVMEIAMNNFNEFLEMSEDRRLERLLGCNLYWYQRMYIRLISKWWSLWRDANPTLYAYDLWESIYKQRF